MLDWLAADTQPPPIKRLLLEPYLEARWGLESDKIKFQGCQAARHDDHVAVEI